VQRILAATDGSEIGDRAVDAAAELAAKFGAELILVHVIAAASSAPLSGYRPSVRDLLPRHTALGELTRVENVSLPELLTDEADRLLEKAKARAAAKGAPHAQTEIRAGEPAEAIAALAREKAADAIVLGKRGLGRIGGLLLGSVSQKLVMQAPCAVLIVP
jgi:nucleotide-binding universal stress UspA family protein